MKGNTDLKPISTFEVIRRFQEFVSSYDIPQECIKKLEGSPDSYTKILGNDGNYYEIMDLADMTDMKSAFELGKLYYLAEFTNKIEEIEKEVYDRLINIELQNIKRGYYEIYELVDELSKPILKSKSLSVNDVVKFFDILSELKSKCRESEGGNNE